MNWYEQHQAGLGLELVARLDFVFQRIVETPAAFPIWQPDLPFRRAVVTRFPYMVCFWTPTDTIEVVAVAHQSRKPGYWRGRVAHRGSRSGDATV